MRILWERVTASKTEAAQAGKEVGRQGDRLTTKKVLDTQWPL